MSNENMIALELTKIEYGMVNCSTLPETAHEEVLKSYEFYTNKLSQNTKNFDSETDLKLKNSELISIIQRIRMAICEDNNSFVDKDKLTNILEGRND